MIVLVPKKVVKCRRQLSWSTEKCELSSYHLNNTFGVINTRQFYIKFMYYVQIKDFFIHPIFIIPVD